MQYRLIIISVACVSSLVPAVHGTGIVKAKIAGAMAMKGAVLKGAGALLSAKADALKNAAALMKEESKEVSYEPQEEHPPAEFDSTPELLPQLPIHTVEIESVPLQIPIHTIQVDSMSPQYPIHTVQVDSILPRFPIRTIHVDSMPPQFPIHTVQVESPPKDIHEHLKDKLTGVWSTLQSAIHNKKNAIGNLMNALKTSSDTKSPVVYKYVTAPRYYTMPLVRRIKV